MKAIEIRRERLRQLIEKHGTTNLANKLGYRQPSFLTQMAGPNPTRDITEKSARAYEAKLGLPDGFLDQPLDEPRAPVSAPTKAAPVLADLTPLVAEVVRLVGSICQNEKVTLPPQKFAEVVTVVFLDTVEHNQTPRPDYITQIVKLLK